MLSAGCALNASSRAFTNASASWGVKNSLAANCAGRSSGVYVALVQSPVRSGTPSAVRGIIHVFFGPDFAAGDWATRDREPRDAAATAAISRRVAIIIRELY